MPTIVYRILAAIGVGAILLGIGYYYGRAGVVAAVEAEYARKLAASVEQAHAQEQKWQSDFNLNARNLTNEINSIATHRDSLLARLRQREGSGHLPTNPGTDCPRPDWRTIPAEMGSEVIREVAERDTYREGLIACYAAIDSLRVAE